MQILCLKHKLTIQYILILKINSSKEIKNDQRRDNIIITYKKRFVNLNLNAWEAVVN